MTNVTRNIWPVSINRLAEYCNLKSPFGTFTKAQLKYCKKASRFKSELNRSNGYDLGRVKYFKQRFEQGLHVDPIILHLQHNNQVNIWDGWHRCCGAYLAGKESIVAEIDNDSTDAFLFQYVTTFPEFD